MLRLRRPQEVADFEAMLRMRSYPPDSQPDQVLPEVRQEAVTHSGRCLRSLQTGRDARVREKEIRATTRTLLVRKTQVCQIGDVQRVPQGETEVLPRLRNADIGSSGTMPGMQWCPSQDAPPRRAAVATST